MVLLGQINGGCGSGAILLDPMRRLINFVITVICVRVFLQFALYLNAPFWF